MTPEDFQQRVRELVRLKIQEAITANRTGGALLVAFGALAALLAYWVLVLVVALAFDWLWVMPFWCRCVLAGGLVLLLFHWVNRFQRPAGVAVDLGLINGQEMGTIFPPSAHLTDGVDFLAPGGLSGPMRFARALLLAAPQMVFAGREAFRRAERLRRIEAPGAAAVFALLLGKERKVPFARIIAALPEWDVPQLLLQLGNLEGVLWVTEPFAGLALSTEWREEFIESCRSVATPEPKRGPIRVNVPRKGPSAD